MDRKYTMDTNAAYTLKAENILQSLARLLAHQKGGTPEDFTMIKKEETENEQAGTGPAKDDFSVP